MILVEGVNRTKRRPSTALPTTLGTIAEEKNGQWYELAAPLVNGQYRYTKGDLLSAQPYERGVAVAGSQIINDQNTLLATYLRRKAHLVALKRGYLESIRSEYRREWAAVLQSTNAYTWKTYWRKYTLSEVVPEKRVRVRDPKHDTWTERQVPTDRKVRYQYRGLDGRMYWDSYRVTRKVLVRSKKSYKEIVVRPTYIRVTNHRVPEKVHVRNWEWIREEYLRRKVLVRSKYHDRLVTIRNEIKLMEDKIQNTSQQFHCMEAASTAFWVGLRPDQRVKLPKWIEPTVGGDGIRFALRRMTTTTYGGVTDAENLWRLRYGGVAMATAWLAGCDDVERNLLSSNEVVVKHSPVASTFADARSWVETATKTSVSTPAFDGDKSTPSYTVLRPSLIDEEGSDLSDEMLERQAWLSVTSLSKSSDFVFNYARSIAELKDTKQTVKQAGEFLKWVGDVSRGRVAPSSSVCKRYLDLLNGYVTKSLTGDHFLVHLPNKKAAIAYLKNATRFPIIKQLKSGMTLLAGLYLATKFAVDPTIDDVNTLLSHSKEWLISCRRSILELRDRSERSSTYHCRSKWRAFTPYNKRYLRSVGNPNKGVNRQAEAMASLKLPPPAAALKGKLADPDAPYWRDYITRAEIEVADSNFEFAPASPVDSPFPGFGPISLKVKCPDGWSLSAFNGDDVRQHTQVDDVAENAMITAFEDLVNPSTDASPCVPSLDSMGALGVSSYAANEVEGVVFANYCIDDVLGFFSESSRMNKLNAWLDSTNLIVTAWELTPLSFIEDWITNSASLARALQQALSVKLMDPPAAEVWGTRKYELRTGCATPKDAKTEFKSYVVDWYWAIIHWHIDYNHAYGTPSQEGYQAWVWPKELQLVQRLSFKEGDNVLLGPSCLRRAARGPVVAGSQPVISLRPRVAVDCSKLTTLAAMLFSLAK